MMALAKKRKLSGEVGRKEEVEEEISEGGEDFMNPNAVMVIPKQVMKGSSSSPPRGRAIVDLRDAVEQVFTNGLIVSKIVQYLPVKDLIDFRLLSRIWNREAVKKIKLHHKLIRFDAQCITASNPDAGKTMKVVPGPEMESFVSLINASPVKVFTRFAFHGSELCHPTIVSFLESYGLLVEEVKLEWDRGDLSLLSSFRELILFAVPNVRVLRLQDVPAVWGCARDIFPSWLADHANLVNLKEIDIHVPPKKQETFRASYRILEGLLSVAPNVETVPHLRLGGHEDVQCRILNAFAGLERENVLKAVEFVTFNHVVYETMAQLSTKPLFIQSMYFNLWDLSVTLAQARQIEIIEAIENILKDQKSHLKYLHLEITAPHRPYINLPVLPKLAGLKIVRGSNAQVVPALKYGVDVPNLKELCIVGGKKGFGSKLSSVLALSEIFSPNSSVEKLILVGCIESAHAIRRAASIFPNVKHLSLTKVADSAYPVLWSSWPDLEECYIKTVFNVSCVDSVFTGISMKTCGIILRELACEDRARRWYSNSVGFYPKIAPTITRWKKLRKLYINYTNVGRDRPKDDHKYISDATGCMAFSKMPSLKELVIGYCKISKCCAQILSSKIDMVRVSRSCPDIPYFEDSEDDSEI